MHFMLVNDDGYNAEGIRTLARVIERNGHRATICAPDRQRSGYGHGFTSFYTGMTAFPFEEDGTRGWKIGGTPADCAKLGLFLLKDDAPDLVISGINDGSNIGLACVYSGTVGGAMEASMSGTPAIASSLMTERNAGGFGFEYAAEITLRFALWAIAHPLTRGDIYNLNVPDMERSAIKPVRVATQSALYMCDPKYSVHTTEIDRIYFCDLSDNVPLDDPESDLRLLQQGWCTVTPLTWNCVRPGGMEEPDCCLE